MLINLCISANVCVNLEKSIKLNSHVQKQSHDSDVKKRARQSMCHGTPASFKLITIGLHLAAAKTVDFIMSGIVPFFLSFGQPKIAKCALYSDQKNEKKTRTNLHVPIIRVFREFLLVTWMQKVVIFLRGVM